MDAALEKIEVKGYSNFKQLVKNDHHEILKAHRTLDGETVIIKRSLLYNNFNDSSKTGHEFEILKDLNHPGIPKAHELMFDGRQVALIREFGEGTDLREYLFRSKVPVLKTLKIVIQLSDILHYIHEKGIIHKDIKPGNIIINHADKIQLIDFAISSNFNAETDEVLNPDQIEGSLNYISPEQTGRTAYSVTRASDFYSVGIVLFELLAGKLPFDSVDPLEIIHFHLSRKPAALSTILPEIPKALEEVIAKLTEKNPDERYQSAVGLKADLEKIYKHLDAGETLMNFKPGLLDVKGEYRHNQKLYGRELELELLLSAYTNLNKVKSKLLLVAGYSGVGKSALIKHVKFPIIQGKGTFISGKFDQFKKDIPYYAFIEAISEFIKNLLTESEEKINFWKERITDALGENAGLITDVIPQLSKIIDKQPAVTKLQPAEQETRFNKVLLDFVYVFSTSENPLVIFLDDLQWTDLSSLNLVKRIIENPRNESVLILGAYRDNEVEKGHPLLITLKQIEGTGEQVKIIPLKPLDKETTCKITADSFAMNTVDAGELGELVYSKTKGNPFFIHSFLKTMYDNRLITSDANGNWIWSNKEISELDYTENVIDLMTEGMIVLPQQTQEIIKNAAVLGNTFSLTDLADIAGISLLSVFSHLKPAIKGGYVNAIDKKYRALALSFLNINTENGKHYINTDAQFSFTHDKVQQAAYGFILPSELPLVHLKIGRLMLQNRDELQISEDTFEVLNHFFIGKELITEYKEKSAISALCLSAGRKAKDSTSYNLGVRFLEMGRDLLAENSWTLDYNHTYNIFIELGECEYLNNNPVNAEHYFREILGYAKTNFEKLKVYYIHSSLYLKIGNTHESLRLGIEAAQLYNIRFPKNKNAIQLLALITLAKYLFLFSTRYKNPDTFFNIKNSDDEEMIALNKFLIDLATSAYQQDQNLMMLVIFKIIKYFIRHGFTDASGWGFSGFSVVALSALKMQKRGFKLWDFTVKLHQKTESPLIKWRLSYTVLSFYNPWKIPLRDGFNNILETIKACVLNGDQIFTGYSVALYLRTRFAAGVNLNDILESSEDHSPLIKNEIGGFDFFFGFNQLVKTLAGKTSENSWNDAGFDGNLALKRLQQEGNKTKLAFFHTSRLALYYHLGKFDEALVESEILQSYRANIPGDLCEALHAFYTSLTISACYEGLSKNKKSKYLKIFKSHLADMNRWAKGCPQNYQQHLFLMQAELFALNNQLNDALACYEKSIQTASLNHFHNVEALACERAALFCAKTQLHRQSRHFIAETWEANNKWGAVLKCNQLENEYPGVFMAKTKDISKVKNIYGETTLSSKTALDLASVLKASQSITSQVKYDDLLKKLMHITIENAGAERGCLLLYKENRLCIEALGISGSESIEIIPSVPVTEMQIMPDSILNYCWRSKEVVVINDACNEGQFSSDTYIQQHKIYSVLCVPISAVGKNIGLLYLENRLIKGVFNKNRIELLQMLSGQIGISIENAILYGNLEEKVIQRTREIEKALTELKATQSQLIQSEKMASLGELTAGIAHEIQNPLNFVNNFSEVSNELIEEVEEERAKNPESRDENLVSGILSDIKQNLEKINHHGKRAADIVKGMLQHSRTSSGQKELTDINLLADEYLRLAFHGLKAKDKSFNADFKTDFDPNLPKINVIPQEIGRVLLNLINNAFYAVQVKTQHAASLQYKPAVTVSTAFLNPPSEGRGAWVSISVRDNGPGIPSHIVDKIFQPFFTTKPTGQGTGLGLSLSYDIVNAHGGELKVETKEGEGSEFIVELPA